MGPQKNHSKAVSYICIFSCLLQNGICYSEEIPIQKTNIFFLAESGQTDAIIQKFEDLEVSFQKSQAPLLESKKFLDSFINEINTRYAMELTIQDACQLIIENIDQLGLPEDIRAELLVLIPQLTSEATPSPENIRTYNSKKNSDWFHTKNTKCDYLKFNEENFRDGTDRHPDFTNPREQYEDFLYGREQYDDFPDGREKYYGTPTKLPHIDIKAAVPDKTVAGIICILVGVLVCLVPGGQGVGEIMITTGVGLITAGAVSSQGKNSSEAQIN